MSSTLQATLPSCRRARDFARVFSQTLETGRLELTKMPTRRRSSCRRFRRATHRQQSPWLSPKNLRTDSMPFVVAVNAETPCSISRLRAFKMLVVSPSCSAMKIVGDAVGRRMQAFARHKPSVGARRQTLYLLQRVKTLPLVKRKLNPTDHDARVSRFFLRLLPLATTIRKSLYRYLCKTRASGKL